MPLRITLILFVAFSIWIFSCKTKPDPTATISSGSFTQTGSIREINILPDEPDFPEGKGRSAFMSNCSQCHSLRYISSQPDFPRKIWEAEVNKMLAKYHAPIDSAVAVKIVDYLSAIKGVKPKA